MTTTTVRTSSEPRASRRKSRPRPQASVGSRRASSALLHIPDVHCWECSGHLELALEAVRGIERAEVDADIGVAWINFEPDIVRLTDIVSGIRSFGYEEVDVVSVTHLRSGADSRPNRAA